MIKILALIFMLLDHMGRVIYPNCNLFMILGRLSFPLFAWELSLGFNRTKNFKNYILKIFLLGVITQPLHYNILNTQYLNVCFLFFISLLILKIIQSNKSKFIKFIFITLLTYLSYTLNIEYNLYGLLLIVSFFYIKNILYLFFTQTLITIIAIYMLDYSIVQFFAITSLIIIYYFKKYDFKINSIVSYSFYPAHLFLLYLINK